LCAYSTHDGVVVQGAEIVQLAERRRKSRIMEEALAPGSTVADAADRNGGCRSQTYGWLRQARKPKAASRASRFISG